jgi:predicted ABC-type ATPase
MTRQKKTTINSSVTDVISRAKKSGKPLAIIVAGHNGSGKSTMWYDHLVDDIQIPLINADRMMLSILPQAGKDGHLRPWAQKLRDKNEMWMAVAQKGVEGFVAQAMTSKVPFAVETVFSYWKRKKDGTHASKIDMIRNLQQAGYFVLLLFVGLSNAALSMGRVATRKAIGGHDVDSNKLASRFPRTQQAIRSALPVADAVVLVDNSRDVSKAFTPCYVSSEGSVLFDIRISDDLAPEISNWLDIIAKPLL